jgi:hypothetical protein
MGSAFSMTFAAFTSDNTLYAAIHGLMGKHNKIFAQVRIKNGCQLTTESGKLNVSQRGN